MDTIDVSLLFHEASIAFKLSMKTRSIQEVCFGGGDIDQWRSVGLWLSEVAEHCIGFILCPRP